MVFKVTKNESNINNIVDVSFQYEVPRMALGCKNKLKNLRSN